MFFTSPVIRMVKLSRKLRKNRCARNGRKNQLGGVITNQWTFDGSKIAGVNNYGQVNKVFSDCDYKAPSISVPAGGLPGFAPAATPAGPLGFLKFWGGKRRLAKRTQRKRLTQRSSRKQAGGGGGIGYSRTDFEVVGGVNPIANQRALGCESGAAGPSASASMMPVAAPTSFLSSLKFWGGKRKGKPLSKRSTQRKRRTHRKMRGGASDLASAFAPPMNPTSPLTLTAPYSGNAVVYESPRVGFSTIAPTGGNNAGQPPYEIHQGYDASKPVVSGPCLQKGGKRKTKRVLRSRRH
jgi:hypothetical protein